MSRTVLSYYLVDGSVFEAEDVTTDTGEMVIAWTPPVGASSIKSSVVDSVIERTARGVEGGVLAVQGTRESKLALHTYNEQRVKRAGKARPVKVEVRQG